MRTIVLSFLLSVLLTGKSAWLNDLDEAKRLAREQHEFILLNFSGSDWCGPCIKMHDEVFESESFRQYAASHLILVNADFPRLKKNQLSRDLQKKNDALADQYNRKGIFPCTLLLDSTGRVIQTWEGFFSGGGQRFIEQIQNELSGKAE